MLLSKFPNAATETYPVRANPVEPIQDDLARRFNVAFEHGDSDVGQPVLDHGNRNPADPREGNDDGDVPRRATQLTLNLPLQMEIFECKRILQELPDAFRIAVTETQFIGGNVMSCNVITVGPLQDKTARGIIRYLGEAYISVGISPMDKPVSLAA